MFQKIIRRMLNPVRSQGRLSQESKLLKVRPHSWAKLSQRKQTRPVSESNGKEKRNGAEEGALWQGQTLS